MKQYYLKILTVLCITLSIIACDSPGSSGKATIQLVRQKIATTVWDRMTSNFELKTYHTNARVQRFIKQLSRDEAVNLVIFSEQAGPYVYHITEMLEDRGMPSELALLPIIESEYMPLATSKMGATGIWQLAPILGRIYGLKQDSWYDGRKDIERSTAVALEHLQYLADKYNGDWLLALAAYNCGHGRVDQAIRKNKQLGKATDYWALSLPQETMYFVPKFLAVVHLVANSTDLDINLAPIPNKPYFTKVILKKHIGLHKAAELAKVDISEIKKLNPACKSNSTPPQGPHQILLPAPSANIFKANYVASTTPKAKPAVVVAHKSLVKQTTKAVHTVNKGDTLIVIASKYKTTVKSLKHKNNLKSDIIRSGQRLFI